MKSLCTVKTPWDEPVTLSWQQIAPLAVTSGQIIAGDPFTLLSDDAAPFAQTIEPARYPVRLVLGHYYVPEDPAEPEHLVEDIRVVLAVLCLGRGTPVRWENALPSNIDPLLDDEVWTYTVDSGNGAFLDASALSVLHWRYGKEPDFVQQLVDTIGAHYTPTYDWSDIEIELNLGTNLVTFATYSGDGDYASYWGYDKDGRPLCLVTDFDALDTKVWQTLEGHWADVLKGVRVRDLHPHRRQARNFHVIAEHWERASLGRCGDCGAWKTSQVSRIGYTHAYNRNARYLSNAPKYIDVEMNFYRCANCGCSHTSIAPNARVKIWTAQYCPQCHRLGVYYLGSDGGPSASGQADVTHYYRCTHPDCKHQWQKEI